MRQIIMLGGLLLLAACGSQPGNGSDARSTGDPLAAIRAAIVARNYGDAVQLAQQAVTAHPGDAAAQYQLARAEALTGNQGKALDALDAAVRAGLADPATALADPAFDIIRGGERFAAIEEIGRAHV